MKRARFLDRLKDRDDIPRRGADRIERIRKIFHGRVRWHRDELPRAFVRLDIRSGFRCGFPAGKCVGLNDVRALRHPNGKVPVRDGLAKVINQQPDLTVPRLPTSGLIELFNPKTGTFANKAYESFRARFDAINGCLEFYLFCDASDLPQAVMVTGLKTIQDAITTYYPTVSMLWNA